MADVVIIDDDPQILELFVTTFSEAGHSVRGAADGAIALQLLADRSADLVITDIIMPEKDGIEVILALRALRTRPAIIAISGGSTKLDMHDMLHLARMLKVELVLQKPLTGLQLLEVAETVLLTVNSG